EYILKNPVYIGKVRWTPTGKVRRYHESKDTIITDGTHAPLIDAETFAAVQAKLEQQRRAYGRYHREDGQPFMLKGLVKCSCCGSTLVSAVSGKSLQCHNYSKGKCPQSHSITLASITPAVLEQITDDFTSMDFSILSTDGERVRNDADRAIIDRQIEREQLKLHRIREAYESGIDTLAEYRENKRRIQEQIERLEQSRPEPQEIISTAEFVRLHTADLEKLKRSDVPEEEKNQVIRSFVQKVVFNRETSTFSVLYHAV
ncbi:MAG: recombinase family protein, partial [Butyricicoccus sp.]